MPAGRSAWPSRTACEKGITCFQDAGSSFATIDVLKQARPKALLASGCG